MRLPLRLLPTLLPLLALAVCAQAPARAADLSGIWKIEVHKSYGVTLRTYLTLRQDGERIEGSVFVNSSSDGPIRDVHADGLDTVFQIPWGWNFRVHPDGENLHVLITYDGGGRDEVMATRAAKSEMDPPARITPPDLQDLPDNGLARTPPMGWNSWNHFAERVSDRVVRDAAQLTAPRWRDAAQAEGRPIRLHVVTTAQSDDTVRVEAVAKSDVGWYLVNVTSLSSRQFEKAFVQLFDALRLAAPTAPG